MLGAGVCTSRIKYHRSIKAASKNLSVLKFALSRHRRLQEFFQWEGEQNTCQRVPIFTDMLSVASVTASCSHSFVLASEICGGYCEWAPNCP